MDAQDDIEKMKALISNINSELREVKDELNLVKAENLELKAENKALKLEVKDLRAQLKQNSKNSHKPPSTDIIKAALPRKKGGKRGGKDGHEGNTLKMVAHADKYEIDRPKECIVCGHSLEGLKSRLSDEERQVFDIVLQPMAVTSYKYEIVKCNCGALNHGKFPAYATQSAQYGPNIKAFWTVLNNECRLPFKKIQQLTYDIFEQDVNIATVLNSSDQCYKRLAEVENHIKSRVSQTSLAHFDETGVRTAAKNYWVHVASTKSYTYLFGHENRGRKAIGDGEVSVLPDFKGRAVHDSWSTYFSFDCEHALCNAHILRELKGAEERGSKWAVKMHDLLMDLYLASEQGDAVVSGYDDWVEQFVQICLEGEKEEPPAQKNKKGKPKRTKSRNLLERLIKYQNEVLAFAKYEEVPFTNNLAERDIRNIKIKTKVATSFRTYKGLKIYTRIQSFISTLKKQNLNVFSNLKAIFEANFDLASFK